MFKNRTYMSGLGLGLIVGAILLQLMLQAKDPGAKQTAPVEEMDPSKLKEAAAKYYQVFDKNEKLYTQAELDAKVQEALKAQPQNGAGAAAQPAKGKQIAVLVSEGLVAAQVSELLYRSGVIVDRNAFEKMLNDQQITSKIQAGYHVFDVPSDPQQVIEVLTSKQ